MKFRLFKLNNLFRVIHRNQLNWFCSAVRSVHSENKQHLQEYYYIIQGFRYKVAIIVNHMWNLNGHTQSTARKFVKIPLTRYLNRITPPSFFFTDINNVIICSFNDDLTPNKSDNLYVQQFAVKYQNPRRNIIQFRHPELNIYLFIN